MGIKQKHEQIYRYIQILILVQQLNHNMYHPLKIVEIKLLLKEMEYIKLHLSFELNL